MKYIESYREGEKFAGTYLCKEKRELKTKAGKTYYSLLLQDKTGTADAKVWELTNGIDHFEPMDYIHCDGMVTSFQGSLQMNVSRIRVSQEGEYDPADYVPTTSKDINEMYTQLTAYVASVKEPHLKTLLEAFFVEDKDFVSRFKKHSAAKSVHHSFMGGLLEHTLSVANMCNYFAKAYPLLNRDLLLTAALFHDIGKMEELETFPQNDYSDNGQLLGHIYMGTEQISAGIAKIPGFPKKLASELKHCILAHHGKLEYGSPKVPALMEAMALNLADNADAKLQTMTEIFGAATVEEGWLGYNRLFESNLRRTTEEK
jgi:3'-5' exoribonuclease